MTTETNTSVDGAAPPAHPVGVFWGRLCGVQRFSFLISPDGGVKRVLDRTGAWIEMHEAQAIVGAAEDEIAALREQLAVPSIKLTPHEVQSGLDRVRYAELLIRQLPEHHDGRNTWLLNYGSESFVALTEATLQPGDIVTLKSGGPRMTVERSGEDAHAFRCCWFGDDGKVCKVTFPAEALSKVKDQ